MAKFEVSTSYETDGSSFDRDAAAIAVVGGDPEESGWGCGQRDLGWLCETRREANEVKVALESIGMPVSIMRLP